MDARIAVLDEIFDFLKDSAGDLRQKARQEARHRDAMRDRTDRRLDATRSAHERNFRILFSALATTALGLAA